MPRGGQNRKPTALKVLMGTNRPGRDGNTEPQIQGEVDITPPTEFEGIELIVWNEAAPILKEAKILTKADLLQLKIYCVQWAVIEEARQHIRDHGTTLENGRTTIANPACNILKQASAEMRAISTTLGLDPSARSRLDIGGSPKQKTSPFADL